MIHKSQGNMYPFVSHTWNTIKGKCPHKCEYCYMLVYPQGELRFAEGELKTNLGQGNFIFVGSSCDMFAKEVNRDWIFKTFLYCSKFDNRYLFQSKNPARILEMKEYIPKNSVIGTTIESNRIYRVMGKTPSPEERAEIIHVLGDYYRTMVTIEPILDFDIDDLVSLIKIARPTWINIGADSKNHNLPEPSKEKILELIERLKKITTIEKKSNLERILT